MTNKFMTKGRGPGRKVIPLKDKGTVAVRARHVRDPTKPINASEFMGTSSADIDARLKVLERIASQGPATGEDVVLFLNDKDPTGKLADEYEMLMEW